MSDSENGSANANDKTGWKPGKRDAFFLAFVAAVVLLLVIGTGERTTRPTPNDEMHQKVTSRSECLNCHELDAINDPKLNRHHHVKEDQCFQCHKQPDVWKAPAK
jgi:hypothetical protein